CYQHSSGFSF
nr:immunoglobulin light chain junction region [Macaca mulatta]MOV61503.1 immunoglobulin light chain junction region [Macaca mulatta]MOV61850.1 immunoglobulin light chain junction region [Macaca mulatta]MOV62211.1 immunoglobulin light chain junction region [Macaca mulatta]MOV62269.1 immunoglobulin light chain junction region [Macaca mulatta]